LNCIARAVWSVSILALTSSLSFSAVIFDSGTTALSASDPTQVGRLSRSGVPSDWSSGIVFPGVINTGSSYHYETFSVPITFYPFLQVTIDSLSANTFASAYLNSYDPTNLATNYLGDAGGSGNYLGTDPVAFQVAVGVPSTLVVVVNQTADGADGLGDPFDISVEGFTDTSFNDATPEPATLPLCGIGLALAVAARRGWTAKRRMN
jgi:hypothetical protein